MESGEEMNNINKQEHLNVHSGMESVPSAHPHEEGGKKIIKAGVVHCTSGAAAPVQM